MKIVVEKHIEHLKSLGGHLELEFSSNWYCFEEVRIIKSIE